MMVCIPDEICRAERLFADRAFTECYIDGIWNKESEKERLTEIQLPIE